MPSALKHRRKVVPDLPSSLQNRREVDFFVKSEKIDGKHDGIAKKKRNFVQRKTNDDCLNKKIN